METSNPPPMGDQNRGPGMIATTIIVSVLADIAVCMRMWVRVRFIKKVGWDDWTIVAATLGITVSSGLVIVQVHYGFGRHKQYLTKWQFIEFQKYSDGEWIQTFATLMFTKISICFLLLRFTIHKIFIRPIQALIASLVVSNVILTVLWIFQCRPPARAWNTMVAGTCFTKGQVQRIIIAQAIISIVSDFILATFPILILRNVQISFRTKVGLCSLMGLGVITGAICIARTVLNWQNVNDDPTWLSVDNWYLRSWEVCVGIIAACIPTLRPGYLYLTDRLRTRFSETKYLIYHFSRGQSQRHSSNKPDTDHDPYAKISSVPEAHARGGGPNSSATSEDLIPLPLQNFEVRKTTRIDVDFRDPRTGSTANEPEPGFEFDQRGGFGRTESQGRIRGVEDIV